jgi:hypothetical protein
MHGFSWKIPMSIINFTETDPSLVIGWDAFVCVAAWQGRSPNSFEFACGFALRRIARPKRVNKLANCFC